MSQVSQAMRKQTREGRRSNWSVWHVAFVLVGFIVAVTVFRYTGDSDVVLAIGSGAGIGLAGWLFARLHLRQPRDL